MPTQKLSQTLHTMSHEELLEHLRIEMKFLGKLLKYLDGGYVDMPDQYENVAHWAKEFYEEMTHAD